MSWNGGRYQDAYENNSFEDVLVLKSRRFLFLTFLNTNYSSKREITIMNILFITFEEREEIYIT